MNILHISQILPIPGIDYSNDFVFKLAESLEGSTHSVKNYFIRTIPYTNKWVCKLFPYNQYYSAIVDKKHYSWNNYDVHLLKFISARRVANFHAVITSTIFYFNRKRINSILSKKIDIIHAHYIFPDGLLAYLIYKKYKIPYVITTHRELDYFDHRISRKLSIKILTNAKIITPLNFKNYSKIKSYHINHIEVIPLGIDEAFLKTVKHYQQDSSHIELLTIAELIPRKNIAMIIKAFSILSEKHDNLKYTIIGRGQERENLANLVSSLNLTEKVKMIDHVNHKSLPEMMSHYDIFILASWNETFGRVYFEAMASGLPVICSKNTGIYGYFVEGSEAMSVWYDNLDDIVKTLSHLIDNPLLQKKLGENGRELVKDFTWEKISKRYLQYYISSVKAFAEEPDTKGKTLCHPVY